MMGLERVFATPVLTRGRVAAAYGVAVASDVFQLLLGPVGWAGVDEAIDIGAMAATSWLIGFHPLLLPTFVVELLPLADMLPTWTGCVALVVALRKREQRVSMPPPRAQDKVIDV